MARISNGTRSAGTGNLPVPQFSGETVQTWISFITKYDKDIFTSTFTGGEVNVCIINFQCLKRKAASYRSKFSKAINGRCLLKISVQFKDRLRSLEQISYQRLKEFRSLFFH